MNTSQYQFVHGRLPRGPGVWAFRFDFTDGNGRFSRETCQAHGRTLGEARKTAWKGLQATVGGAIRCIETEVLP